MATQLCLALIAHTHRLNSHTYTHWGPTGGEQQEARGGKDSPGRLLGFGFLTEHRGVG